MSSEYGVSQLQLLEGTAGALYREAVAVGSIGEHDPRWDEDQPERPALDLLVDLGLLVVDRRLGSYLPIDPANAQSRVVAPMSQQAARLINESTSWANVFAELGQSFRRSGTDRTPVMELRGYANINRFLQASIGDAVQELLTAQSAGARPPQVLGDAQQRDIAALRRGVAMRTLYQHSARRSFATREYVEKLLRHGGEVRTLDQFFNRLIVIDRQVAVVPSKEDDDVAIAIYEPSLVNYLVDIFERYWERAADFTSREESTVRSIADDVHNMTVRMLTEGHSDHTSAKRVGVSVRTYAGYVAALKDEYGAATRFQLGFAMGQEAADGASAPRWTVPLVRSEDRPVATTPETPHTDDSDVGETLEVTD